MLSATTIKNLIETQDLITGYINLDEQIQQNGVDLTVRSIHRLGGDKGTYIGTKDKIVPNEISLVAYDNSIETVYSLWANSDYKLTLNERVKLPTTIAALVRPRSTVIRLGHSIHTAVWDAGYEGNSTILLRTGNRPLELALNARICQMVFFELDSETTAYNGQYQGEV